MKVALAAALLFFCSFSFSAQFSEPYTGLTVEIPDSFQLNENSTDVSSYPYWYTFIDKEGNTLTIEIDECDTMPNLSEHVHRTTTDAEHIINEGLEFGNVTIGDIEFTKLTLRILGLSEIETTPLFLSDYLFVHGHFGIIISLIKKEEGPGSAQEADELMMQMIKTITFPS